MRSSQSNKYRNKVLPYGAVINFLPGSADVLLRIGTLTGNLALNINDPNTEEGDRLIVMVKADASARVVTIGGTNAGGGTVNLSANGEAVIVLYASAVGTVVRYLSAVVPV